MMTDKDKELLSQLEAIEQELVEAGWNLVRVASRYGMTEDTHFNSRVTIVACPTAGVTEDHILLDVIREISVGWSNECHASKLVWQD